MTALYARVSTQEQAEHGNSIEEQIDRMQSYCDALNLGAYKVYTDAGFSGSNTNRPALRSMLKDIHTGKISRVLVYKLDRLSRSQKDTLSLIEDEFLARGCDFVSMSENFDTSTPFGKASIGILAVFAQLEREQIKERMTMGRVGRAKKGLYIGSRIFPIGYDYKDGNLTVIPFEAVQIRRIFDLYASGMNPQAIANDLNSKGMTHRYGKWRREIVSRVLDRRLYLGEVSYSGQWHKGLHEPIITEEQFQSAQERKKRIREDYERNKRKRGSVSSFLGGLLQCSQCGEKYWLASQHQGERSYHYYQCNGRRKHICTNKTWRCDDLDSLVFGEIKKLRTDPDRIETIRDDSSPAMQSEIDSLTKQIDRLIDLYAVGNIPVEALESRIRSLDDKRSNLLEEMENLSARSVSQESAMSAVFGFADALETGDFDQIRDLLTAMIERIDLDGEDITIHWRFI